MRPINENSKTHKLKLFFQECIKNGYLPTMKVALRDYRDKSWLQREFPEVDFDARLTKTPFLVLYNGVRRLEEKRLLREQRKEQDEFERIKKYPNQKVIKEAIANGVKSNHIQLEGKGKAIIDLGSIGNAFSGMKYVVNFDKPNNAEKKKALVEYIQLKQYDLNNKEIDLQLQSQKYKKKSDKTTDKANDIYQEVLEVANNLVADLKGDQSDILSPERIIKDKMLKDKAETLLKLSQVLKR